MSSQEPAQEPADLRERLVAARARVRALRKKLDRSAARVERLETDLAVVKAWTLDVFPDHHPSGALRDALDAIRDEKLTFLTAEQLASLTSCVLELEAAGREGILVEAGTARGGSAIAMALAKSAGRELRVYDVFGMIPPPTEEDGEDVARRYATIAEGRARGHGDDVYYGYRDDLLGEVRASFERHGVPVEEHTVVLVPGLFQDTLVGDEPVALAHVDGDWYESTMVCLERLAPRIVPGGRIVIDDYFNWSGCRTAVDTFFAEHPEFRLEMRAKVHAVRRPDRP